MALYAVTVVAAMLLVVNGESTENITMPEMPLSYFKSFGFDKAYTEDEKVFTKMYLGEIEGDNNGYDESGNKVTELRTGTDLDVIDEKHAGCSLYDQIVELPNDRPNVNQYPSCILLKQCGGCCGHSSVKCKPTMTKNRKIKVMQYVYDGVKAEAEKVIAYLDVVEHTECQCSCKIEQSDCNSTIHDYDDYNCQCTCKQGPQQCPTNKRWDEGLCSCQCAKPQQCGTGYFYNMDTCRCQATAVERAVGVSDSLTAVDDTVDKVPAEKSQDDVDAASAKAACAHLRCSRGYKPVWSKVTNTCNCQYSRGRR